MEQQAGALFTDEESTH